MGCFLGCFGTGDSRRRKSRKKSLPRDSSRRNYESIQPLSQLEPNQAEVQILLLPETRENPENLSFNGRKKVTFDLNVNTYIDASTAVVLFSEADGGIEKEEDTGSEKHNQSPSKDPSTQSNQVSFPENHRYQNCVIIDDEEVQEEEDDEDVGEDYEDSDLEDYDDDADEEPEMSQESCFSLPLDGERRFDLVPDAEREDISPRTISTATGARDRSQYVHSVLNPVENLSQWKAVKTKPSTFRKQKKENIDFEEGLEFLLPPFSSEEPTFKSPKHNGSVKLEAKDSLTPPPPKPAVAVDASLSNWLSPSQATKTTSVDSSERSVSQTSYSPRKYEDRPILGALTVEEIKSSTYSSPRKSPSRSPDDIPILGTVGSYWSHQSTSTGPNGMPNTTSKYTEDKRVIWHSTPFQVRLERALNRDAAEVL